MGDTRKRVPGRHSKPDVHAGEPLRVFISYSRRDSALADALVVDLEHAQFDVTIDRRDLPYGEEWQKELGDFIRQADIVVWLVSPDSTSSKWCNWELGEVARLNKRLVPIRIRDVAPELLPEHLGRIHLLPAEGAYRAPEHLGTLIDVLNSDRAWVKESTRLADRAREWIGRNRDGAVLLRGRALGDAERWSTRTPASAPGPSSDILELLLASRRGAVRRQRWAVVGALAVAGLASVLAAIAWQQRQRAEQQLQTATAERLAAIARAAIVESIDEERPGAPDRQRGALLALESLTTQATLQGDAALRDALRRLPGPTRELKLEEEDRLLLLGPQAQWVAIRRGEQNLILDVGTLAWRGPQANELPALAARVAREDKPEEATSVWHSPDGRFVLKMLEPQESPASAQQKESLPMGPPVHLMRATGDKLVAALVHEWGLRTARFRRDGRMLMTLTGTVSMDASDPAATRLVGSTLRVWEVPTGNKLTEVALAHWGGIDALDIDETENWVALQSRSTLLIMPIWPDLAREEACRRLTRNLSPSEWVSLVGRAPQRETCPGLPQASE